ncbi:MAG: monofunctional biosynthetic peptidoglycan transglycosylase [Paludibacteraceae bacterium]|nr:monofunctional biosynthetic peptidoglycan transglycosylase [Paludibacteraceae bacterium]
MVKRFVKFCAVCAAIFFASSIAVVIFYRFAPVRYTPLMLIRKHQAFSQGERLTLRQEWVPIEYISPDIIEAVIEAEDARFYEHGGFSYNDMLDAFYRNRRMGCIVAGGSTISQQTAKNVFCTPARTYTRKLFEAYFTVLIELFWGKERIMEVYLNVIELGYGLFGVEAAAQEYYGTTALRLNYRSARALASIIPCPVYYDPNEPSGWNNALTNWE